MVSVVVANWRARTWALGALLVALPGLVGCQRVRDLVVPELEPEPPPASSVVASVPPPRAAEAPKVAPERTGQVTLADGRVVAAEYADAVDLRAGGQLWLARLKLERKALGDSGTSDERVLLRDICKAQADFECMDKCAAYVGDDPEQIEFQKRMTDLAKRKPAEARDALVARRAELGLAPPAEMLLLRVCSAAPAAGCPSVAVAGVSTATEATAATASDAPAPSAAAVRKALLPKASASKASAAEFAALRQACVELKDRACIAVVDAKHR